MRDFYQSGSSPLHCEIFVALVFWLSIMDENAEGFSSCLNKTGHTNLGNNILLWCCCFIFSMSIVVKMLVGGAKKIAF